MALNKTMSLNFKDNLIPPSGRKWLKPLRINILTHSPRFKPWAMFLERSLRTVLTVYTYAIDSRLLKTQTTNQLHSHYYLHAIRKFL